MFNYYDHYYNIIEEPDYNIHCTAHIINLIVNDIINTIRITAPDNEKIATFIAELEERDKDSNKNNKY